MKRSTLLFWCGSVFFFTRVKSTLIRFGPKIVRATLISCLRQLWTTVDREVLAYFWLRGLDTVELVVVLSSAVEWYTYSYEQRGFKQTKRSIRFLVLWHMDRRYI